MQIERFQLNGMKYGKEEGYLVLFIYKCMFCEALIPSHLFRTIYLTIKIEEKQLSHVLGRICVK